MKKYKNIQIIFFVLSILTLIYEFSLNYAHPFSPRVDAGETWKEYVWIPFYFTNISNVCVAFMFGFKAFAKEKILKSKKFLFFEFVTLENILWTCFAYCFILSWFVIPSLFEPGKLSWGLRIAFFLSTAMVHLIMPSIALFNFLYERIKFRKQTKIKANRFYYAFLLLISPFAYLILNLIIYFSLGAEKSDNVYPFMAILDSEESIALDVVYFVLTFSICYSINLFTIFINNKFAIEKNSKTT